MEKNWENKTVLVTAGSTWVSIDSVRVITNIFSGSLGYSLAQAIARKGAHVMLLLGNGISVPDNTLANLEIVRYKYFSEFEKIFKKFVSSKKYDVLVHSAAISDYGPELEVRGKIKSDKKKLVIKLKKLPKLVDLVRKLDRKIFLVKFKLEVGSSEKKLLKIAYDSMKKSDADLMVANDYKISRKQRVAYTINRNKLVQKFVGKENIVSGILNSIQYELERFSNRD